MDSDRRIHHRYRLWLPARLEGATGTVGSLMAVGHDMSQKGALLVTRQRFEVGAEVTLHVRVPPDGNEERAIEARVLRCDSNDADPEGLWPLQLALEFVSAHPDLEEILRQHSAMLEGLAESGEQP